MITWSSRLRLASWSRGCGRCFGARRRRRERDGASLQPPVRLGLLLVDVDGAAASWDGRDLGLTGRELALLDALARNAEVVLGRDRLLEMVWGYDFAPDSRALDVFMTYLRRKLEAVGAPRLVETVRGVGFVLRQAVILRSLTARVVVGAVLVVSRGARRWWADDRHPDRAARQAGRGRRLAALCRQPHTGCRWGARSGSAAARDVRPAWVTSARFGQLLLLDRNGKPIPIGLRAAAARPPRRTAPAPGVVQALVDAFNQRGQSSTPAGQIVFVRALRNGVRPPADPGCGPARFPADVVAPRRAHGVAGRQALAADRGAAPIGVIVEVGALAQSISARAARLRTIVIWTGVVGLLVVLVGTVITSRVSAAPVDAT